MCEFLRNVRDLLDNVLRYTLLISKIRGYSLVNNAGISGEDNGMVHQMTEQTWDKVMSINCRSVFLGCKYACAQFLNQTPHTSGHRGWIVNTSSIMGLVGQPIDGGTCKEVMLLIILLRFVLYSRLFSVKRSSNSFDKTSRYRVRKTQSSLQLRLPRT